MRAATLAELRQDCARWGSQPIHLYASEVLVLIEAIERVMRELADVRELIYAGKTAP